MRRSAVRIRKWAPKDNMITDLKVLDNFYGNPEHLIKLLDGDYPIIGCGTGSRSIGLQEICPDNPFENVIPALLSM